MARKKKLMDYLNEFIECGTIQDTATLNGDYKANNKAYKKTEKIFSLAKDNYDSEEFYLAILATTVSASALTTCCAHMMKLKVQSDVARKKLEEIQKNKEYHPIFRSNVKLFLQEWDKGNIKPIV